MTRYAAIGTEVLTPQIREDEGMRRGVLRSTRATAIRRLHQEASAEVEAVKVRWMFRWEPLWGPDCIEVLVRVESGDV
jgi:hypothetical protein